MTTTELIEFFFNIGTAYSALWAQFPQRIDMNLDLGNPIVYSFDQTPPIVVQFGAQTLVGRSLELTVESVAQPGVALITKTSAAGQIAITGAGSVNVTIARADTLLPGGIGIGGFAYALRQIDVGAHALIAYGDFEVTDLSPG